MSIMKITSRLNYLNKLVSLIGVPDIKIITGIRRSGKSVLLGEYKKYIEQYYPDANIIYIDLSSPANDSLLTYPELYNYVTAHYRDDRRNFVLVDEVQLAEGFERSIDGLHSGGKYDICVTGSNAFLLSSDIATLLSGRTYVMDIYPFSFAEYCEYFGYTDADLDRALDNYTKEGGMPGSYVYPTLADKYHYLNGVLNSLIIRDVITRHDIRNTTAINKLVDFMSDNISNVVSVRKIARSFGDSRDAVTDKTVSNYLDYLTNAYTFYRVRRYDVKGRRYLNTQDKYYLADHVFRYARLGTKDLDQGRIYENMVAIELLRRGYDIYVGALYDKEIDFVAMLQGEQIYIQVSDDISSESTYNREISSLLQIKDAYPRMIIARTHHDTVTDQGVQIVDLAKWLRG